MKGDAETCEDSEQGNQATHSDGILYVVKPLPDYLRSGLDVVFCGVAAGNESATVGHYYANKQNRFWRVLHESRITRRLLSPSEDGRLLKLGIGLTDLVKDASGVDKSVKITSGDVHRLKRKIEKHQPSLIVFNGKKAARYALNRSRGSMAYGMQEDRIGKTRVFVAPSTSTAGNRWWDIDHWHDLGRRLNKEASSP